MIEILHTLKFEEFINELRKLFSIWENRIIPLGNLAIPQNIWPKDPEDICF